MAEKLEPFNLEKVPQRLKVGVQCAHIQSMRADNKTHKLWLTGVRVKDADADDPEGNIAILHCGQCVPPGSDGEVEIVWRIAYMIGTEEDIRKILRNPATVSGATVVVPTSERGMKLMEDEFSKDTTQ